MKHLRQPGFLVYFILFLIYYGLIYYYFESSQTRTIYGDDLQLFEDQARNTHLADIIASGKICFKFRPVSGLFTFLEIYFFKKDLFCYYLFNVGIQAMIAVLFTAIVNLLLRSVLFSALFGLMMGISRFGYYNITQIMCGGPLEGLAMVFFLCALYNIVVYLSYNDEARGQSRFYYLVWAAVFANLAMYTHERYLILFPFLIFITLVHPYENRWPARQKMAVCLLSVLSVFVNFALKKYVYHYPFLLGTGKSSITHDFTMKRQLRYLGDALASIVQFNSGPAYMIGIRYPETTGVNNVLPIVCVSLLGILLAWYTLSHVKRGAGNKTGAKLILFFLMLLMVNLAPAVSTINLEQRWLQAPISLFLLMLAVVYLNIKTNHRWIKVSLVVLFMVIFQLSDHYYRTVMDKLFWMKSSEWMASCYKDVMMKGFMGKDLNTIYILEEKKNPSQETGMNWVLADGLFFDFYQGKWKKLNYMDSTKYTDQTQLGYLINFNRKTEQIIRFGNGLTIITDEVLKERDEYFKTHGIIAKNK